MAARVRVLFLSVRVPDDAPDFQVEWALNMIALAVSSVSPREALPITGSKCDQKLEDGSVVFIYRREFLDPDYPQKVSDAVSLLAFPLSSYSLH